MAGKDIDLETLIEELLKELHSYTGNVPRTD